MMDECHQVEPCPPAAVDLRHGPQRQPVDQHRGACRQGREIGRGAIELGRGRERETGRQAQPVDPPAARFELQRQPAIVEVAAGPGVEIAGVGQDDVARAAQTSSS